MTVRKERMLVKRSWLGVRGIVGIVFSLPTDGRLFRWDWLCTAANAEI